MSCIPALDQEFAKAMRFIQGTTEFLAEASALAYESASEVCSEFGDGLNEFYNYIGRQVCTLAHDQLGEEAATFVAKGLQVVRAVAVQTFHAAPITAISLLAPTWITAPFWIGYTVIHLAHDKPFTNRVYDNINTGMGNAYLIRAATSASHFLTTGNPVHALSALFSLAIAGVWHGKVPATDDPEGPNKGDKEGSNINHNDDNQVEELTSSDSSISDDEGEINNERTLDHHEEALNVHNNNNVESERLEEVFTSQ